MSINVDELMKRPYKMVVEKDPHEGGYVISFPDLNGCLTCADDEAEIIALAEDAKREWFIAQIEGGRPIPLPSTEESADDYSGRINLRAPKELHRDLARNAERQGVSLNQYCIYALTKKNEQEMLMR